MIFYKETYFTIKPKIPITVLIRVSDCSGILFFLRNEGKKDIAFVRVKQRCCFDRNDPT